MSEFEVTLADGRIAHCWQATAQPYEDACFSAGLVTGAEPDTVYLRMEKDGEEPTTLFLRPDGLLALVWVASGALWSAEMLAMDEAAATCRMGGRWSLWSPRPDTARRNDD